MARQNVPLIVFNRGIISPLALARVDLDRTRLSAEVMTNWLPKTQGAMIIRPGTKHLGSSINDTGAYFVEFIASTTDAALLEITKDKMRIWDADTGTVQLLGRPNIGDLSLAFTDTGWGNASTGGQIGGGQPDLIPKMSGYTSGDITISASNDGDGAAWKLADNKSGTDWDTSSAVPHWWKIDFGSGNTKRIKDFTIRAANSSGDLNEAPQDWVLEGSNDDAAWTTIVTVGVGNIPSQTDWAVSEKRTFSDTGWTDTGSTGTPMPGGLYRYWRLNVSAVNPSGNDIIISEIELFEDSGAGQAIFGAEGLTLNATSKGALAKAIKQVVVTDTGGHREFEHSLALDVTRGPVTFRTGSTAGDDDYIAETSLGTGFHNLAFTPFGNFHITIDSDDNINRIVGSIAIGDTGTVEITAPWSATDLDNIRYDQSADVTYVDTNSVHPYKIERRGTGRSWSVVEYKTKNGPFLSGKPSSAKLNVQEFFGNTTLSSDIPFFKATHEGALFRLTHDGQSGDCVLGALNASTPAIKMTGISDTGANETTESERQITIIVTGTWTGTLTIERSFDDENFGFKKVVSKFVTTGASTLTSNGTRIIDDEDDNVTVWYRVKFTAYTSGAAIVEIRYGNGQTTGIARVVSYNTNKQVDCEILQPFSDTGLTEDWSEGSWSSKRGYPQVPALHEGRLAHAGKANIWLSVSDDYENFDDTVEGESAPLNRTLGSGPVDNIFGLISLSRLVATTVGSEIVIKSSSLDEPLTRTNTSARAFSTQGSTNLRLLPIDSRGIFVQRSKQRVYTIAFGQSLETANDYESSDLTVLVPELLKAGVVSVAIQRQPDTRLHCVLSDGKVAIMTYEPQEEVLAWSMWETDGTVERAMVLPGIVEDKVFYHINRTIDGSTKRYLEQWALESECQGDTGLSWLADCAASYTEDGGKSANPKGFQHLAGERIIGWGSDTGQAVFGKDLSADTGDTPNYDTGTLYVNTASDTGDTGKVALVGHGAGVHHFVGGLPYSATYKSTKLAYGAQMGTALAQLKRADKIGFVLNQTHNNGLFFGSDTGHLDPMPRVVEGATVDPDLIHTEWDKIAMPFPGLWDTDSRIYLKAKAPRPATVTGAIPGINTHEK